MSKLSTVTSDFVGRIAVAVWIGRLTEEGAREALEAYASACQQTEPTPGARLHEALLAEYRRRREGHDLCS